MFNPAHPGATLREDILPALGLSVTDARQLGITHTALSRILNGHAGISPEMARRIDSGRPGHRLRQRTRPAHQPRHRPLAGAAIAHLRGLPIDRVRGLVEKHTQRRQFGVLGEARVNVLRLNLALDAERL